MSIAKSELVKIFGERFKEYADLWQVGEYYGAVKRLAEISHCLPKLNDAKARKEWQSQIHSIGAAIPNEIVIALEDGVGKDAERISTVLSYGTRWNEDEILLVLGMRIEIDFMMFFLREYCSHNVTIAMPLEFIDAGIVRLARSKEHKRHIEWAIGMMKKNWGLPIESDWLRLSAI